MKAQRSRIQKPNKENDSESQDNTIKPKSSTVMTGAQRYTDNFKNNNNKDQNNATANKGLANLKGVIQKAKSSGKINISYRELDHIPEQILTMYHVDPNSIVVDFNSTSGAWYDDVELTKFIASDNEIKVIDDRLGKEFGALTSIDFRNNHLSDLPSNLSLLKQLTVLQLSLNRFEKIPDIIFELSNLRELNMSKNQISVIPDTIGNLNHLENLDFSENQIGPSLPNTMAQLTNLRKLDLGHNKLTCFPLMILSNWSQLHDLILSHNRISHFQEDEDTVYKLPSLIRLELRNNNLQHLSWNIELPKLKEIFLTDNRLISENKDDHAYGFFQYCSELQTLDVSSNQWSIIPNSVTSSLEKLQRLDVRGNQLKQLPSSLGKLPNLTVLLYEGNPLKSAPRNVPMAKLIESLRAASLRSNGNDEDEDDINERMIHLKNDDDDVVDFNQYESKTASTVNHNHNNHSEKLESLSLSENITSNTQPITKTTSTLDLSHKKLKEVHDSEFTQYDGVQILQLHHNEIINFPSLSNICETLVELELGHNKITVLKLGNQPQMESIVFPHLKILNLNNNGMKYLEWQESCDTIKFPKLEELNICHNTLTQLPVGLTTRMLPSLRILRVSNNYLANLEPESLTNIEVLDIANNDLISLPSGLGLITSLKDIAVHGNRFRVPQPSIVAQGSSAVLAFLKRRAGVNSD
ncbi:unnamed protein product [Cunninghamella blakesleeana]